MRYGSPDANGIVDEIPTPTPSEELQRVFTEVLPRMLPGFAPRPAQWDMACAVEDVLSPRALPRMIGPAGPRRSTRLCVEAPCGTGKSLAYGIPAALYAARRRSAAAPPVVIATAGIALQEQLITKDLPLIQRALAQIGLNFDFALLKGLENYACVAQVATNKALGFSYDRDGQLVDETLAWVQSTSTGDRSELPFEPPHHIWRQFAIPTTECTKGACPARHGCFGLRARVAAQSADIIVTNHHMLCAHVRVGTLPEEHILIVDEAHELPDVARRILGSTLYRSSPLRAARLIADQIPGAWAPVLDRVREEIEAVWGRLTAHVRSPQYKAYLRHPNIAQTQALIEILTSLTQSARRELDHLAQTAWAEQSPAQRERGARLNQGATRLLEAIADLHLLDDLDSAYAISLETPPNRELYVERYLIDPAPALNRGAYDPCPAVITTSATLTTNRGSFAYTNRTLGIGGPTTQTMVVPSPFDFPQQGLLVLPELPVKDTNDSQFIPLMTKLCVEAVRASRGGALCLFTSYRAVDAAFAAMSQLPWRVLKQGEMPKLRLLEHFREDPESILLGTTSLWTGVDVPGDALRLLFIDKIPFPQMFNPVMCAIADQDPKGWFSGHSLPTASLKLQQGVGRLIRSVHDRGVCVIADPRMTGKGYGKQLIADLPAMQRTRDVTEIAQFFAVRDGSK